MTKIKKTEVNLFCCKVKKQYFSFEEMVVAT